MQTIREYALPVNILVTVELPASARILSVRNTQNVPMLSVMVYENDTEMIMHSFAWRATGYACDDLRADQYFTSMYLARGDVLHLFYLGTPKVVSDNTQRSLRSANKDV